jgi:hypothetical protein
MQIALLASKTARMLLSPLTTTVTTKTKKWFVHLLGNDQKLTDKYFCRAIQAKENGNKQVARHAKADQGPTESG